MHDVSEVIINVDVKIITANFSPNSSACGALIYFIFISDVGEVDLVKSAALIVDKSASSRIPRRLYPGYYEVYAYDIEEGGTVEGGVGYPAWSGELFTKGEFQGRQGKV